MSCPSGPRRQLSSRLVPLALLTVLAVAFSACRLVDQRTFDPAAGRAPVPRGKPPAARPVHVVPPLFVVRDPLAGDDWKPGLASAVRAALARKPNVLFTVQSVVPGAATPAAQASLLSSAGSREGRLVADAITADGARPAQVELAAAVDPALHGAPEVRVLVQ